MQGIGSRLNTSRKIAFFAREDNSVDYSIKW